MSAILAPRVVVVTRKTDLELLVAEHGTREQARFMTRMREGWFDEVERRNGLQRTAIAGVSKAIPTNWRRAFVDRAELATFGFAPEDIIVPVGQDGLVANVAKYLAGQPVLGVNPDPENVAGALVKFTVGEFEAALSAVDERRARIERRTMVMATLDDGQSLIALNEVFVGHRTHQSARYRIRLGDREERQSSSGVIVATGTGFGGWARSIAARDQTVALDPCSPLITLLVREAFPGPGFGTDIAEARLENLSLTVTSEMGDEGTIFGDGIEVDALAFSWGHSVDFAVAPHSLQLACDKTAFSADEE